MVKISDKLWKKAAALSNTHIEIMEHINDMERSKFIFTWNHIRQHHSLSSRADGREWPQVQTQELHMSIYTPWLLQIGQANSEWVINYKERRELVLSEARTKDDGKYGCQEAQCKCKWCCNNNRLSFQVTNLHNEKEQNYHA